MLVRELAAPYPTVQLDDDALHAARLLADNDLPGLIVVDADGLPHSILPGTQVLRFVLPRYVQDDAALARVVDEHHADMMWDALDNVTVRQLLPPEPRELPLAAADDTMMEVAALMARTRSPVVAVVENPAKRASPMLGAVTLDTLLDRMLAR